MVNRKKILSINFKKIKFFCLKFVSDFIELMKMFKVAPYCFLKTDGKCKFRPQKVPMDISEKNETKVMHRMPFRASNTVNG